MCHYFANYWSEDRVFAYHWIQNDVKLPIRHIVTLAVYEILKKKVKIVQMGSCDIAMAANLAKLDTIPNNSPDLGVVAYH